MAESFSFNNRRRTRVFNNTGGNSGGSGNGAPGPQGPAGATGGMDP